MTANNSESGKYRQKLGLLELVALGVGGTVGSGIFVVPGSAAALVGSSSLWIWLLVGFSATCTLLCLRWTSSRYPGTGTFYTIFHPIFGKNIALTLVVCYLISTIFGISTIAAGMGQYFSYLNLPDIVLFEILVIVVFCLVNIRGIYLSGMTETVLTILKIIPLFAIAFLLIPRFSIANLVPFPALTPITFTQAILLIYWPYTGFEISAIPADEVADTRLIRKSLSVVITIVIILYVFLNFSLLGALGGQVLGQSPAPLATAAILFLPQAGFFISIIAIIAMISALNAYLVGGSRVLQNLAITQNISSIRDLNKRGTPQSALILCAIFSAALLFISNQFDELAIISVVTTLIPYLFVGASALLLFPSWRYRTIACFSMGMTLGILLLSIIAVI